MESNTGTTFRFRSEKFKKKRNFFTCIIFSSKFCIDSEVLIIEAFLKP
jgi:hypothetical protein